MTAPDTESATPNPTEYKIVGVSTLDDYVLLGDAGLAMAMVAAGAERLVDLRGETTPPRLPIPIDHFPIIDLEPDQDELIAQAAAHIAALAKAGTRVGVYCQAGIPARRPSPSPTCCSAAPPWKTRQARSGG